jgi:hypothetical protein
VAEMTEKVRRRLAQFFALLGSDNVYEREAARTKLDEILRRNRKTWNDLVELLQTKTSDAAWIVDDDEQTAEPVKDVCAFDLVRYVLHEFVDLKPHEYVAVALWILHSHVFDRFVISPRLALTSPVRGCGKTTLLALIEILSARAQRMDVLLLPQFTGWWTRRIAPCSLMKRTIWASCPTARYVPS